MEALTNKLQSVAYEFGALDFSFAENKRNAVWSFVTQKSRAELVYLKKSNILHPPVLFARIYPQKNMDFYWLAHELQALSEEGTFDVAMYPYVNKEDLTLFAEELMYRVKSLLTFGGKLIEDAASFEEAKDRKIAEIASIIGLKGNDIPEKGAEFAEEWKAYVCHVYEERVLIPRFTSLENPYYSYALGNIKKAKGMTKKWKYTEYEERFLEKYNRDGTAPNIYPKSVSEIIEAVRYAQNDKQGTLSLALIAFGFAVFGTLFGLTAFIYNSVASADTIYYSGAPWYFFAFIGILPGLFGGIAFRRPILSLLMPKKKHIILKSDSMTTGKSANVFINTAFGLALAFTLVCACFVLIGGTAYYSDSLVYRPWGEFFPVGGTERLYYEDADALYRLEGRYNGFDEYIEKGSYAVVFKDGTVYDFYGDMSAKEAEENILPLIIPFTGEAVTVKSDKDIPK